MKNRCLHVDMLKITYITTDCIIIVLTRGIWFLYQKTWKSKLREQEAYIGRGAPTHTLLGHTHIFLWFYDNHPAAEGLLISTMLIVKQPPCEYLWAQYRIGYRRVVCSGVVIGYYERESRKMRVNPVKVRWNKLFLPTIGSVFHLNLAIIQSESVLHPLVGLLCMLWL